MADIAIAFHWSERDMRRMYVVDLIDWRKRAARRMPKPSKG